MEITGFGGSQFPPGFRFYPTDQELIIHYMRNKVTSSQSPITSIIADVDIYKFDPWELPDKACFGEGEWFFFSPRDRKYPNGSRPNRAAASGYWKATGTDKPILTAGGSQCLGVKKSLVFYKGRPPKGIKTDWIMHEYRLLEEPNCSTSVQKQMHSMRLDDWVLCRVRHKGSIPASESQDFPNPSTNLNTKQQQEPSEKNTNMCDWIGDYNEFEYLFNPGAEGSRSGYQTSSSDDGKSPGLNEMNFNGCANNRGPPPSPPPPPPDMDSSMLNSVKRTLSVGTLDELMLMHPCKKINYCSSSVYDQFSPSQSFSIDQAFPEFTEYLI